jgi:predicted ester cyclase
MGLEANKRLVRRLIDEVVNQRNLGALDEVAEGPIAESARMWIGPFRDAFPDFTMEVIDLVAEGDKVVALFACSGTHLGTWMGMPPTGRRFEGIDEVYIFRVSNGKLAGVTAVVEDNLKRMSQLGLDPSEVEAEPLTDMRGACRTLAVASTTPLSSTREGGSSRSTFAEPEARTTVAPMR